MGTRKTLAASGGPGRAGWVLALVVAAGSAGAGWAQAPPVGGPGSVTAAGYYTPMSGSPNQVQPAVAMGGSSGTVAPLGDPLLMMGGGVVPASGCSSCGSSGGYSPPSPGIYGWGKKYGPDSCAAGGCGDEGCGENGCVPGRSPCVTCEGKCMFTRVWCAFHNALCCPDPCYEPRWKCGPNAALFVDYARPVTQTRLRWDYGQNLIQPDRSEFFWAAQGLKGPGNIVNGRVQNPETRVNYNELTMYQEFAADRFSFFISMPYRNLNGQVLGGQGGFGDMTLGTKSMLLDSELLQFTFQFATTIPIGNPKTGIGVGHVSLTPSLLTALKLYPETYLQSQLGYWIPISATSVPNNGSFAGGIFQFNHAINHVLCKPLPDTAIIGSIEQMGYVFSAGRFTDPASGLPAQANSQVYMSVGPGFRVCVCDKVDLGFGVQFAVTNPHFANQLYRTEFRWRF